MGGGQVRVASMAQHLASPTTGQPQGQQPGGRLVCMGDAQEHGNVWSRGVRGSVPRVRVPMQRAGTHEPELSHGAEGGVG